MTDQTSRVTAGRERLVFAVFGLLMAAVVIAGSVSYGRAAQLREDQPSMVSDKDLFKLEQVRGCTVSRQEGFRSYVCSTPPVPKTKFQQRAWTCEDAIRLVQPQRITQ